MKCIFTSICLGLALAFTASAQDRHQGDNGTTTTTVHRNARASSEIAPVTTNRRVIQPTTTRRDISTAPFRQRTYVTQPSVNTNATIRYGNRANARVEANVATNRQHNVSVNRTRTYGATAGTNTTVNRNGNVAGGGRTNVAVTNNWQGAQFSGRQYSAFRDYRRTWHDRDWWRSHYSRVIFVSGGWWCWDAGYWYPCWGYDPSAYYPYDGPIYGYADLTPEQIVAEVQAQLQADDYYAGPIDGVLGPMTRQAIAAFQADHGLAITSTVDEPTIATLGIS